MSSHFSQDRSMRSHFFTWTAFLRTNRMPLLSLDIGEDREQGCRNLRQAGHRRFDVAVTVERRERTEIMPLVGPSSLC